MTSATTICRLLEDRKGVRLKQEYVESWLRSLPPDLARADRETVLDAAFQDFLSKDIADTSRTTIPANFGQEDLFTFPPGNLKNGGGVVLQLMDALDISNSAHSLLNSLATVAPVRQVYVQRNNEEITFPRGMLRLTLSDGVRMVRAIELTTISNLDLKTPYGCKMLVKNCQVRRGLMLLEANNVKVLGGAVPELYGGNMISELEKRLKLRLGIAPVNEPPQQSNVSSPSNSTSNSIRNTNSNNTDHNFSNYNSNNDNNNSIGNNPIRDPEPAVNDPTAMDIDEDFYDDMDDVDMDELCAVESMYTHQTTRDADIVPENDMLLENYDEATVVQSPPMETIDLSNDKDDASDIPSLSLPSSTRCSDDFKSFSTSNTTIHAKSSPCTYNNDKTTHDIKSISSPTPVACSTSSSPSLSKPLEITPDESPRLPPSSKSSSSTRDIDLLAVGPEPDIEPPLKTISEVIDALEGKIECPDIVRVKGVLKMFTKIKIATSKFFVVIILVEPYDYEKQLKIVLRGKLTEAILDTTAEALLRKKREVGERELIKYLQPTLLRKMGTICEVELDLSSLEDCGKYGHCPCAKNYKVCKKDDENNKVIVL